MSRYDQLKINLKSGPKVWLITGVAGFIGSNLLEALLKLGQFVVGLDNFSTGKPCNLEEVRCSVNPMQWQRFQFIQGDVRQLADCHQACHNVNYVLHQAALGSVGRSIDDPVLSHQNNIDGFLNMLVAARDAQVNSFIYASSSSVYGDHPSLPKVEEFIGTPLSPYALTKYVNELYADVFRISYEFNTIGLRYFNVFGPRQNPVGAYAAVIPQWITAMIQNQPVYINGDGQTSRDFCYINNAVQCNLLAATVSNTEALNQIYNVAVGERMTLVELYQTLQNLLKVHYPYLSSSMPIYREFRKGDVPHSQADINKAKLFLNYQPSHSIAQGLGEAVQWYDKIAELTEM